MEVAADQPVEREIIFPHPRPGAMDAPVERHQQRDGEFRNRVRRIGRHTHHRQPQFRRRDQIDIIIAGTAQRDQPRAAGRQLGQNGRVQPVVDEHADRLEPFAQARGIRVQTGFQEMQFMSLIGGRQEMPVIALGAEDRDAHGAIVPARPPSSSRGIY